MKFKLFYAGEESFDGKNHIIVIKVPMKNNELAHFVNNLNEEGYIEIDL